jgi:hypothetical protein
MHTKFLLQNLMELDYFGDKDADERIILKLTLDKDVMRM